MKACAHCGETMADASPRCLKCGMAVEGDVVGEIFRTVDQPLGEGGGPNRILAVLIFSVLLLAAAAVYMLN
jgi:hypothetical protein